MSSDSFIVSGDGLQQGAYVTGAGITEPMRLMRLPSGDWRLVRACEYREVLNIDHVALPALLIRYMSDYPPEPFARGLS